MATMKLWNSHGVHKIPAGQNGIKTLFSKRELGTIEHASPKAAYIHVEHWTIRNIEKAKPTNHRGENRREQDMATSAR